MSILLIPTMDPDGTQVAIMYYTISQFSDFVEESVIISNVEVRVPGHYVYVPPEHRCVCEMLANTYHLWSGKIYIVPGLLLYTWAYNIIANRQPCTFWSKTGDIIAISCYESESTQLMLAMWAAARDHQDRIGSGSLRDAYRIYCGLEPGQEQDEYGILREC